MLRAQLGDGQCTCRVHRPKGERISAMSGLVVVLEFRTWFALAIDVEKHAVWIEDRKTTLKPLLDLLYCVTPKRIALIILAARLNSAVVSTVLGRRGS